MKSLLGLAIICIFFLTIPGERFKKLLTKSREFFAFDSKDINGTSFEEIEYYNAWNRREFSEPYSINRSDSVSKTGKYSARFELRSKDPLVESGTRSEMVWNYEKSNKIERWYSFDVFLPNSFVKDEFYEILAQWHESHDKDLGERPRSPPLALSTDGGNWVFTIMWAFDQVNTNQTISGKRIVDLGPYKTNEWINWTFFMKYSYKSDGVLKIWKNDILVLDYKGPNYYNDQKGPFFKVGIYKPHWNNKEKIFTIRKRVVFFDDVKVGKQLCNFNKIRSFIAEK